MKRFTVGFTKKSAAMKVKTLVAHSIPSGHRIHAERTHSRPRAVCQPQLSPNSRETRSSDAWSG